MDFSIFGVQSTTLAITAALTGVLLVVGALVIAWLIGPRSYTKKKGEPFECGIPTRGDSMAQYHVGYSLDAREVAFGSGTPGAPPNAPHEEVRPVGEPDAHVVVLPRA